MALMNVLIYPDPRLRNKAKEVTAFDGALKSIVDDMFETLDAHNGVGLAATQVNVDKRIIVMNLSRTDKPEKRVFINPEILSSHGSTKFTEGCISVPGIYEDVLRAASVKFKAQDIDGTVFEEDCEDLLSNCIQHEVDHLDGILYIDRLSSLKRQRVLKKLKKLQRQTL